MPPGLCWRLRPWARLRRLALGGLVLALATLALARLTETEAEALPFVRGGALPAPEPAPAAVVALEEPLSPALAAGAELLLPGVELGVGEASFYARMLEGRPTASGERYRGEELTAAHRTLPFGTLLRVTNLANGRTVVVRVNDRGPFHRSRILDLSRAAAEQLGMVRRGLARVRLEVLEAAG